MFSWIYSNNNEDIDFVKNMIEFYNKKFEDIDNHNVEEEQKFIKKKRKTIIINCLKYYYNL